MRSAEVAFVLTDVATAKGGTWGTMAASKRSVARLLEPEAMANLLGPVFCEGLLAEAMAYRSGGIHDDNGVRHSKVLDDDASSLQPGS